MKLLTCEDGVEYHAFSDEQFEGTVHGFFTRKGGVSEGQYYSLNLGGSIGDNPQHVNENKRRVCSVMGRKVSSLYEVWQVHSSDVVCTEKPLDPSVQRIKADGIFTSNPEVTLLMRFADCVPIILFDPVKQVVGIVHAGWQGTIDRIVEKAITKIVLRYGCCTRDVVAGIGPSIGPDHYEIASDVKNMVKLNLGEIAEKVLITRGEKIFFDLWEANRLLLENAGVARIFNDRICTACDTKSWFSHRAEKGKTGRFGVLIGLNSK